MRHPSENFEEALLVRDLEEHEYMRRARDEAVQWIRTPAEFLHLTMLRVVHFSCGPLRNPWLPELFIPLMMLPLVYYRVSYVGHHPAVLNWTLLLLAGYEVLAWVERPVTRNF